jgi:Organic Anion Transporter Polypeptide (OATP) family
LSAITIGVRILGPALGFILGSVCTRLYADLSVDPPVTPSDPRWVGAWWLGLVLVGTLLMIASGAMAMFPRRLRSARRPPPPPVAAISDPPRPRDENSNKNYPSLRGMRKTMSLHESGDAEMQICFRRLSEGCEAASAQRYFNVSYGQLGAAHSTNRGPLHLFA